VSEKLYCAHCQGVWVSAAAHAMALDLETCLHCGGPLILDSEARNGRGPVPTAAPAERAIRPPRPSSS